MSPRQERSPSSKYRNISPKQTIALLASLHKMEIFSGQFTIDHLVWGRRDKGTGVGFGEHHLWPVSMDDLKTLAVEGYVDLTLNDPETAEVRFTDAAYLAKRKHFDLDTYDLILAAAYALVDGSDKGVFLVNDMASSLRLDETVIRAHLDKMTGAGEVRLSGSFGYAMTKTGIAVVNDAFSQPITQEMRTPSINVSYSTVGNLNCGIQGNANIKQQVTNNVSVSEFIKLLDDSKAHLASLPDDIRQEAEEAVDHLKEELASPKPITGKIKAYCMSALSAAGQIAAFSDNIHKVCDNFGINVDHLKRLFGGR